MLAREIRVLGKIWTLEKIYNWNQWISALDKLTGLKLSLFFYLESDHHRRCERIQQLWTEWIILVHQSISPVNWPVWTPASLPARAVVVVEGCPRERAVCGDQRSNLSGFSRQLRPTTPQPKRGFLLHILFLDKSQLTDQEYWSLQWWGCCSPGPSHFPWPSCEEVAAAFEGCPAQNIDEIHSPNSSSHLLLYYHYSDFLYTRFIIPSKGNRECLFVEHVIRWD